MLLGKIVGKTTTRKCMFQVDKPSHRFSYVQFLHSIDEEPTYVLAQIIEIEKDVDKELAYCNVLGYKKDGKLQNLRTPPSVGTEILEAESDFIKEIIALERPEHGAYIGKLEAKNIAVHLDLNKLLSKHVAVLAKSGAGKSYAIGVLAEEILDKRVPLVVIDPHGEYSKMKYPSDAKDELTAYDLESKSYLQQIREILPKDRTLRFSESISSHELLNILPMRLSPAQTSCVYTAMQQMDTIDFDSLIYALQLQESNAKWSVIEMIEYVKSLGLFSATPTDSSELVKQGMCTIINLKGMEPEVSEIIVYKLLETLFAARKENRIPPFFTIIEEAHNFCPERSFGETKCSKVIRTIAAEGRKFGMGLGIVSQRPARVDKSVLSQCSTQMILKTTNPGDVSAIVSSAEGITSEAEDEIKNLSVGTAMITGFVDVPLFVRVRPRKSQHGGEAVDMIGVRPQENTSADESDNVIETIAQQPDRQALILPKLSKKDILLMEDNVSVKTYFIPAALFVCDEYALLVELSQGKIVIDPENNKFAEVPDINSLSPSQLDIVHACAEMGTFTVADLMEKRNLTFAQSQDILTMLGKLELLSFDGTRYALNDALPLDLKRVQFLGKVEYESIGADEMIPSEVDVDTLRARLALLADIKHVTSCHIVHHQIVR